MAVSSPSACIGFETFTTNPETCRSISLALTLRVKHGLEVRFLIIRRVPWNSVCMTVLLAVKKNLFVC